MGSEAPKHTNRLAKESSPYLLQHAHNPVDWYPWGDEAFEKARNEDKPIFLSVGYSTCHWCHVMERESFESEAIAAILNESFVAIKLDREERPDVDAVYMAAVQALSGRGGWPMSVFLTHDRQPFFGGTYFPPDRFAALLTRVAEVWKSDRSTLEADATRLSGFLRLDASGPPGELGAGVLSTAFDQYRRAFDEEKGGFGNSPKFPRTHALSFLLRYGDRTADAEALPIVTKTLREMWRGGVYDHLGGGFHRYSTDREWLLPHFEKMLYDQALIAWTYLETYQATGDPFFADVARDIFRYVLRDMQDPQGGFYSAEDADSEGEEGKFYVFRMDELREILGTENASLFAQVYGFDPEGNFHEESSGVRSGDNILHLPVDPSEVAKERGLGVDELAERLATMRSKLFDVREERIHPYKDDKVLADWNGLMIAALAFGGRVLDDDRYTDAARRAAEFVISEMRSEEGRLLHRYRGGQSDIPAFLDDHAFLGWGLFELYQTTQDARWLREARGLVDAMIRQFHDGEGGGFYFTANDAEELLDRAKELYDGAVPSGNSVAAWLLARLGHLNGEAGLIEIADRTIAAFAQPVAEGTMNYPMFLIGLDYRLGPRREVVVAGERGSDGVEAFFELLGRRFLPKTVVALHPTEDAEELVRLVPFMESQSAIEGRPTAYFCEDYSCLLPVHQPGALEELLAGGGAEAGAAAGESSGDR